MIMRNLYINNPINTIYLEVIFLLYLTVGPVESIYKLLFYFIYFLLNSTSINNIFKGSYAYWLLIIFIAISMTIDLTNIGLSNSYSFVGLLYIASIFCAKIFIDKYSSVEFYQSLCKVCCVISMISLLFFFMQIVRPDVINSFPIIRFFGRPIRTVGVYNAIYEDGPTSGIRILLRRNSGIAFEPGAFQFVPALGLASLILLSKNNISKSKLLIMFLVFSTTIITTASTTGIAILIVLTFMLFYKDYRFLLFVLVMFFLSDNWIINTLAMQNRKIQSGNIGFRFENTLFVLKNFPGLIFGIGSTYYDYFYQYDKRIGSWDLYTNLYLRFGFLFLMVFFYYFLAGIKNFLPIIIVVFLTLLTQTLLGPITFVVLFFCIKKEENFESIVGV